MEHKLSFAAGGCSSERERQSDGESDEQCGQEHMS